MYVKYGVINDDLCYNFREIKMYELFERHRDIMKEFGCGHNRSSRRDPGAEQ